MSDQEPDLTMVTASHYRKQERWFAAGAEIDDWLAVEVQSSRNKACIPVP